MSEPENFIRASDAGVRPSAGAASSDNTLNPANVPALPSQTGNAAPVDGPTSGRKRSRRAGPSGSPLPAGEGSGVRDVCQAGENQLPFLTEEELLAGLARGASYCQDIERQPALYAGPELNLIMKLHRVIILKLSTQAEARPELWDVLKDLMKPVMDWARLQEQQKDREFAERKFREQQEAEKAEEPKDPASTSLSPETLEKIEFELKLL